MGARKGSKRNNKHLSRITVRNMLMDKPDPAKKDKLLTRIEKETIFTTVLDLRKKGYSLSEIAKEVGISQTKITKLIAKLYDREIDRSRETLDHCRKLDLDRLDAMIKGLWTKIEYGDTRAIDIGIKVLDRRAKLLGLDAPEKKQVDVSIQLDDSELINEAKRLGIDVAILESLETSEKDSSELLALPPIDAEFEVIERKEDVSIFPDNKNEN